MANIAGEQLTAFSEVDAGRINVVLMLCFAVLLAWSNGANDIANSVGAVRTYDQCGCACVPACRPAGLPACLPACLPARVGTRVGACARVGFCTLRHALVCTLYLLPHY